MEMALSFNKLITKIGDNISKVTEQNDSHEEQQEQCRPVSPFIMLLSEGDEFKFTLHSPTNVRQKHNDDGEDIFDRASMGSSLKGSSGNISLESESIGFESSGIEIDSKIDENYIVKETVHDSSCETFDLSLADDNMTDDEEEALKDDERRSFRNNPLKKEQFELFFDPCGRLVGEHELRRAIFKGGVDEDIRKNVWQFLFELYPFNTTASEREILKVEQILRYEAMKIRWKKLLKTLVNDYEGVRYCPKWFSGCPENSKEHVEYFNSLQARLSFSFVQESSLVVDNIKAQKVKKRVMIPVIDKGKIEKFVKNDDSVELENLGLICHQNDEIELDLTNDSTELLSSSYDERLSQVHILSQRPLTNKTENETELSQICMTEQKHNADIIMSKQIHLHDHIPFKATSPKVNNNPNQVFTDECDQKNRTTSVNFECGEIDSLSEAIADAMVDLEINDAGSTPTTPRSLNQQEDFDMLYNEKIPLPENTFKPIHCDLYEVTDEEDESCIGTSDIKKVVFPNPFTLPAEYINNQESLYSKSENFKSLDFMNFENYNNSPKQCTFNNKNHDSSLLQKENSTEYNDSLLKMKTEEDKETDISIKVERLPITTSENNQTEIFKIISSVKNTDQHEPGIYFPVDETDNEEQENLEVSEPDGKAAEETVPSTDNGNFHQIKQAHQTDSTAPPDIIVKKESIGKTLTVAEHRDSIATSPTGELIENIPPWIKQMMKASTPSSPPKHCITPTGSPDKLQNFDTTDKGVSANYNSMSELVSPIPKEYSYNAELIGIVENATKYLKEQSKNCSSNGRLTPKGNKHDEVDHNTSRSEKIIRTPQNSKSNSTKMHQSEILPAVALRPKSCSDIDLSINTTPKYRYISNGQDDIDYKEEYQQSSGNLHECPYCDFDENASPKILLPVISLGDEQLKFMEIQAQFYAARQNYNEKLVSASIRVIDKDVPRTDRELPQFKGDNNLGLVKLRDSLLTYAFFHPDVGYAQGMNDIMSRFLVVMDTEAEAYWMFVNYMEVFKNDFMEEGMLRKIALVEQLLMKMDRELYDFLQSMDMGLMFCHRWLLLNFKREFDYMEAIRLFEITSSRHLEVSSVEAQLERSKERAKEFVKDSAGSHMEEIYLSPEYPFDIFVCVTMLMECRHMMMGTLDLSSVYQILSNLPTTLDLQNILRKSEELFYKFCRKTVVDCFQVIDELEVQDYNRKKKQFSFSFR